MGGTSSAKLMDLGAASQNSPVANAYMTCQVRVVSQHTVITHNTVMRNVDIDHQQVVIAHFGQPFILNGTAMKRTGFSDHIIITDNQACGFSSVLFVLTLFAKRSELINPVVSTNCCWPLDHNMRPNDSSFANFDIRADDAIRANLNITCQCCTGINYGRRMNHASSISLSAQVIKAEHTTSPSTKPWHSNFQIDDD